MREKKARARGKSEGEKQRSTGVRVLLFLGDFPVSDTAALIH